MKHDYISDAILSDEESYLRNLHKLDKEIDKRTPNIDIVVELMAQTFANRRAWIVEGAVDVCKICEKFPLLKSPAHVRCINHVPSVHCLKFFSSEVFQCKMISCSQCFGFHCRSLESLTEL